MNFFSFKCYILLVLLYFLSRSTVNGSTPTKNYTSYRIYPWCTPSDYMRYPKTAKDVVGIVQEAIKRGVTVKAFGARHSQTDIICTEGIPIDMGRMKFFQMNSDKITATFGSGVTVGEAGEFLRMNGRALRTTPAYGNITLGGGIGTGAHGSTVKYNSSISSQVVKMTIVNGVGKLQEIFNPEDLRAFRIHLGLLGIVVDVTLYTVPLYKVLAHNYVVSDEVLTNGLALKWVKAADQISLNWFPALKKVVVANLTFVDAATPGKAWTSAVVPSTSYRFNILGSTANEIACNLASTPCAPVSALGYSILHVFEIVQKLSLVDYLPDYVPIYTENGVSVKNPAVGYSDLMFASVCTDETYHGYACPWAHGNVNSNLTMLDNEFGLGLSDLPAFVTTVKDIISKTPTAFPLQGILIRFSGNSTTYMSTSYGKDTAHFEFFLMRRKDSYNEPPASLAGYQTILQALTRRFKGRSHWGKSGLVYHSSDSLDIKLDEKARKNFVAAMNKFDPNEIFINNFGKRMKWQGTTIDIDPLTTRCAILDNCFCTKNSDCGATQICTSLLGYNYRVCKTINEIPEKSFSEEDSPPISDLQSWLATTLPTLVTAAIAKCSIKSLLHPIGPLLYSVGSLLDLLRSLLKSFLN